MITFSVSWISALTNKFQDILFDSFPLAAAPGIRGGCLVPRLYLKRLKLLVWLLMNTSSAWIQITSQKTILIHVCIDPRQLGRPRPATTSSHTKPCRAAFSSSAPSHLQMAEGDVEVKAAFEIPRQAPSSLPFIRDLPPSPRVFVDALHLSCQVTFMEPSQV